MRTKNEEVRISILRFVMIFGAVVLHTPQYVPIAEVGTTWFDLIKAFFQSAMFRCSVPILTVISGYLLFRSSLDTEFSKLASKKFKSIGIPFLAFNLPLVAAVFALQSTTSFPLSYQLVPFDLFTIANAAFGITESPINYPLNFLRDLLVVSLLAPLLGWFIRRAVIIGFIAVIAVYLTNLDGHLILRTDMLVMFYVGGVAAVHQWDLRLLDKYAGICLIVFLGACAYVVHYKVANTTYLRFASPLLLWPASSLLVNTRFGNWLAYLSRYTFFIFLAHSLVLIASWIAYKKAGASIPYQLYWLITPFLTTALLIAIYQLATKYCFPLFSFVLGSGALARTSNVSA